MKKEKILFLLRLPPRLTGATLMNSFVFDSNILRENFIILTVRIPHANSHKQVGKISIQRFFTLINTVIKLLKSLLIFRPRFVYFQISPLGMAFIRDLIFVLVIKLTGTKILYHLHGKGIADAQKNKYYRGLYKFTFHNEEVICLAESLTNDITQVYKGKPFIVPNAIKPELHDEPQRGYSNRLNILYISNIKVAKGIIVFIEALALLKQNKIPFFARIVGNESGISKEQLIQLFQENYLSDNEVVYLGPKYDEEKWNEFKQADVMVFPTLNDIWGLVILEAMQASIPVIASIDGAIPEIISDNETGFLVEKNRPDQICEKLIYLHNNPEIAREMGSKGRDRFESKYTYEIFELNLLKTFYQLCKQV